MKELKFEDFRHKSYVVKGRLESIFYIMDHISLIQSNGRVDRTINKNKLRKNKIKRICQN
jgi:hypothetical protein